ncbi:unnamed protein product [Gongylonema pulchrum]|uniref:Sec5 domain-containing protein n=1 Tax=Gongylonema pulchrum TaxID=637853 RepID=A0A183EL98_9BILA|nr:unnamed protein product [Gongylonema pulchrum]
MLINTINVSSWLMLNALVPASLPESQMLINTINVSSWLMLNALVPASLPESVIGKYREQFAKWPPVSPESMKQQLFAALKILRSCISSMLDSNFTSQQLQPLFELCVTIRLKCLSKVIEDVTQGVIGLGSRESWKLESTHTGLTKTILPDLYETEVSFCATLGKNYIQF